MKFTFTFLMLGLVSFLASAQAPESYEQENLGPHVNSEYEELSPIISPDGKTLYFVREGDPHNTKYAEIDDSQDIWYTELQSDGSWSAARHMGSPLNKRKYNNILTVTPDGNTIMIRGAYDNGDYIGTGFSFCRKSGSGWSTPQMLVIKDFTDMNQGSTYGGYLSLDGKVIVMYLSEKEGTPADIYASFLERDGTWTRPMNLGPKINTSVKDVSPFLAADGKTMYFSSKRAGGYGDQDIWVAKRLDDTWKHWSDPVNMGSTINSDDYDSYYSIAASGDFAFMVTYKNSYGKADIVRIRLKKELKPDPVVLVKGKVYNAKTRLPLEAEINYEQLNSGKDQGNARSNSSTGEYKIVLPYGMNYGFHAKAPGYIAVNENLDLTDIKQYQEVQKDLYLIPIEVGQSVSLKNVFFKQGMPILLSESYPELDRLASILQDNPTMEIELSGHTDNQGDANKNLKLSEDRVKIVKDYLVSKGIDSKRITGKGYGGTKPIASNAKEETRKLNRRVEVKITKK
jgi:OmpA-OmpF porin, OOP family